MTRKEQNKILDDKIKSNVNQYKVDRLNAEISAFSSGDLNKYEFLTRKDLKYKPNALDKARFEFSPLGKAFSTGLDKTAEDYQEEVVIKILKDIRDGLANCVIRPNNMPNRPNDDDDDRPDRPNRPNRPDIPDERPDRPDDLFDSFDSFDKSDKSDKSDDENDDIKNNRKYNNLLLKYFLLRKNINETKDDNKKIVLGKELKEERDKILDLKTKLKNSESSTEEKNDDNKKLKEPIEIYDDMVKENQDKICNMSNKFENNMENSMNNLYKKVTDKENNFNVRLNKLNDNKNIDDTSEKSYDSHGFDKDGFYKDTDRRYDPNGFIKW